MRLEAPGASGFLWVTAPPVGSSSSIPASSRFWMYAVRDVDARVQQRDDDAATVEAGKRDAGGRGTREGRGVHGARRRSRVRGANRVDVLDIGIAFERRHGRGVERTGEPVEDAHVALLRLDGHPDRDESLEHVLLGTLRVARPGPLLRLGRNPPAARTRSARDGSLRTTISPVTELRRRPQPEQALPPGRGGCDRRAGAPRGTAPGDRDGDGNHPRAHQAGKEGASDATHNVQVEIVRIAEWLEPRAAAAIMAALSVQ